MRHRLPQVTISMCLFSISVLVLSPQTVRSETVGDCGDQDCQFVLDELRSIFPETIAQFETECPTHPHGSHLSLRVYQNDEEMQRASFTCWTQASAGTELEGHWLGTLPLDAADTTFVTPFICGQDDKTCNDFLPQLRSNYPEDIQQAEFQCAIKNGSLLFFIDETEIDLRCGFMATTVWDNNGDGEVDYEDQVSVDISVGRFPLNP